MNAAVQGMDALLQSADRPTLLEDLSVVLNVADVLRGQGMSPERSSPRVTAVAEETLEEAQALLSPAAIYNYVPIAELADQSITLASDVGPVSLAGTTLRRAVSGAVGLVAVVCTIGPSLEERMSACFTDGEMLRALALDGAGTAAVRKISRQVCHRIREHVSARELTMGMTASPGQEGWPLEEQAKLFNLLPVERIAVRLGETGVMKPFKSISFVAGLGEDMDTDAIPCDLCSKRTDCRWTLSALQRCG